MRVPVPAQPRSDIGASKHALYETLDSPAVGVG